MRLLISLCILSLSCAPKFSPPNIAEASDSEEVRLPTPKPFTFGPADKISIKVWRHQEMDMEITVAPDGGISYPLLGRIQVAGMTFPQLVERIEEGLSGYYKDVSVAVNVMEVANEKVYVIGEVRQPIVLQVVNDMSIIEALALSGGISSESRTNNVLLVRSGLETPEIYTVDVDAIYNEGDLSQLVYLQGGDIVVVPTKTIANVERYFRRIQGVLTPFVGGSAIYRNVISQGAQGTSSVLQ